MAIGIVSDDELQSELSRLNNPPKARKEEVIEPEIVEMDRPGRDEGDVNVPNSIRKMLGETSVMEGRAEAVELARTFGISPSSVSAYANGSTSTASYNQPKSNIKEYINKSKERNVKRAGKVLRSALQSLTPEKLEDVTAKDLAGIAKDMAAVIKHLEPAPAPNDGENNGVRVPQFVIFAPQFRDERSFDTIHVDE